LAAAQRQKTIEEATRVVLVIICAAVGLWLYFVPSLVGRHKANALAILVKVPFGNLPDAHQRFCDQAARASGRVQRAVAVVRSTSRMRSTSFFGLPGETAAGTSCLDMERAKKESWRHRYVRLIRETPASETELTPELLEDLQAIQDLIDAGYLRGEAIEDASVGYVTGAIVRGPTLAGRVFAEEQLEHIQSKSFWGRLKSGSTIFIGWLSGIISAVIIYYLTKR
jgi:hypothetical protein